MEERAGYRGATEVMGHTRTEVGSPGSLMVTAAGWPVFNVHLQLRLFPANIRSLHLLSALLDHQSLLMSTDEITMSILPTYRKPSKWPQSSAFGTSRIQ